VRAKSHDHVPCAGAQYARPGLPLLKPRSLRSAVEGGESADAARDWSGKGSRKARSHIRGASEPAVTYGSVSLALGGIADPAVRFGRCSCSPCAGRPGQVQAPGGRHRAATRTTRCGCLAVRARGGHLTPPEPVWHTPGPHVSDASPKPEPSSTKLRWSTGSLSVSGHMPGPGRPCLRGHIHISCWQLHGPGAVTHHVPARLIRGGHDVRKPRKRNWDSRSGLSLMRSPRLVSRRLGLEQHYREAAPTIAAIWLNSKMPRQQNLFSQLLNIFAAYLVAIAPDNARPPRTPPSTNDLSSGQSGCQAHCLCRIPVA
jgi:hypothetical protein